eukprot:Pgem_evm1s1944
MNAPSDSDKEDIGKRALCVAYLTLLKEQRREEIKRKNKSKSQNDQLALPAL